VAVYRHLSPVVLYNCIVTIDVSDRGIICNASSGCIDLVSLKYRSVQHQNTAASGATVHDYVLFYYIPIIIVPFYMAKRLCWITLAVPVLIIPPQMKIMWT